MKNAINKLIELKNISGKNDKKKFLKDNENDKLFIDILRYLLDDFILTGISSKKISKDIDGEPKQYIRNFYEYVEYVKKNNTGRDDDILNIRGFIYDEFDNFDFNPNCFSLFEILKQLITKELKLGISAKSFNKVFPDNKIKVFNVMLAKKYKDHMNKVKGVFTITKKLDGIRCIIIKENGNVKTYSRSGKLITNLEHIIKEIRSMMIDNFVFDGELLNDNDNIETDENFRETQSKALSKSANKTNLKFNCFDMIKLDEFYNGMSNTKHIDRLELVDTFMTGLDNSKPIEILYQGTDIDMIGGWSSHAQAHGWEGIMISLNEPYVCKRTHFLLKVKQMHTVDLEVIGFENGAGRFSNTLGSLIVNYKGNKVGVGSGLSDSTRDKIWNNQNDYLNTIVEIQYFEESKDKDGKKSLRFPIFKTFRLDKLEESYN